MEKGFSPIIMERKLKGFSFRGKRLVIWRLDNDGECDFILLSIVCKIGTKLRLFRKREYY